MRTICGAALAACLVLGAFVRADDKPEARAVVEKAIKAMGRDKKEAQFKAATWKGKGKIFAIGNEGIEFSGEWWAQLPDKNRGDIDLDFMGQKIRLTRCIDGDKGWQKTPDGVTDMDKEEVVEEKHSVYANWLDQLYPLQDKAFELSVLGESKVEGRPVIGIKAARKGQRDVNLYFDKDNYTLLKHETRGKDIMGGGAEVTNEAIFTDYKDADGIKEVRKFTLKRDGKVYIEFEFTEFKRKEKLDDNTFKP